jgi:protein-disulfide isomerase
VVVAGAGWLVWQGRGGEEEPLPPLSLAQTTDVTADPGAGTATGPEDAPVTIMEFADFLCPHCREFNALTGRLVRQNLAVPGGPLRWISYDFPLRPESIPPTLAAHCAGDQGKFWQMHDLLFARVQSWATASDQVGAFTDLASDLGLDDNEFRACLRERRHLKQVLSARAYGEQLGVNGTPTLFLNGRVVEPTRRNYSYEGLAALVEAAADSAAAGVAGE